MEIPNREKIAAVCNALLERFGLAHMWGECELLDEAIELLQMPNGRISKEEQAVLLLVWRLSSGRSKIPPDTDVNMFVDNNRLHIETLLRALAEGPAAVDRWLGETGAS